jgi:AAA+ ATPase superfamily predicted ATPase
VILPFLDRRDERAQLTRLLASLDGRFAVVYGRRRCGKSRLLQETLPPAKTIYYVADDRESPLQRVSLAAVAAGQIPGFERAHYPDWDALLSRVIADARPGTVLAIDEFPSLVRAAPELPSVLQRHLDRRPRAPLHVVVAGSSQRLTQGLVLDRTAPLFGRAEALLPVGPLPAGWIQTALGLRDSAAVEAYAVWGGLPRYWELAADYEDLDTALRAIVLSPLGVLHDEPRTLLLDDTRDTVQAASLLSLIARGSHRLSEIAARVERPATSLVRPLQRLLDLGFIRRDVPFGSTVRDTKRTLYHVADPFLRFWFRFVEPARSRLEARQIEDVALQIGTTFAHHAGEVWEDLARASVARLGAFGYRWQPASRWWGPGLDRHPMEIDIVAESEDGRALLVGEARWSRDVDLARLAAELRRKAAVFPLAHGRTIHLAAWLPGTRSGRSLKVFSAGDVLKALR